jgi:TonB-dependent starch-binding outer membrane protein SusC
VVLITTKQGQRGSDHLSMESSYGIQSPANHLEMLNGPQFAELVNEARRNAGLSPVYSPHELEAIRAAGTGTDWQRLVTRDAPMQSHSLSFAGGDARTRYLLSAGYYNQRGIVRGSDFTRYSGRLNLDRTLSDRLQVSARLAVGDLEADILPTDEQGFASGAVSGALWFNPAVGPKQADGSWLLNSPVTWPAVNPVAIAAEDLNHQTVLNGVASGQADLRLARGLQLRSSLAATSAFTRTDVYSPRDSPTGRSTNGQGSAATAQSVNLTSENVLALQRELGPGNLDVTGAFSVQTSRVRTVNAGNSHFVNDLTGADNLGAGTQPTVGSSAGEWALLSLLARANYNLSDRYLLTLTGRRDGSSRFGANRKWGFFPSAAVAWRLVDEPFLRESGFFTDLKLRLSYGVTGNQEIGLYQSLSRLAANAYTLGGQAAIGFAPVGAAPNPDLKWETTRQFDVGLDWGMADNRISGTVDLYRSVTDDLLLSVRLPITSGYTSQLRNVGSVKNDGVELSLHTLNLEGDRFSWYSTLTLAHNRNEVLDLGVSSSLPVADQKGLNTQTGQNVLVIQVGRPLGTFVGKRTRGVYGVGEACLLAVVRPGLDCVPGEYRYVDANGDGRIDANDNVVLGNGQPDLHGGLSNSVTVGPIELTGLLQFSYGAEVLNAPAINTKNVNTFSNQTTDALRRWTPENPSTGVPRANADRPREVYEVHVEDGSFVRLQAVSLGYVVPAGVIPGASSARLFLTGQNLAVWTRYTGFDPEVNSFGNDATAPGVDAGSYPKARSVSFGVNLTF